MMAGSEPSSGFCALMATAAPLEPALTPVIGPAPGVLGTTLDEATMVEVSFAGTRGLRAEGLMARSRSNPARTLWACWWGAPGAPFMQFVAGWSATAAWPLRTEAAPEAVLTLYGMPSDAP
jgi:hypothetical protein